MIDTVLAVASVSFLLALLWVGTELTVSSIMREQDK